MNGKKLSLVLAFLCWLSLLAMNWLLLLSFIERGIDFAIGSVIFLIGAFLFGSFSSENNERSKDKNRN